MHRCTHGHFTLSRHPTPDTEAVGNLLVDPLVAERIFTPIKGKYAQAHLRKAYRRSLDKCALRCKRLVIFFLSPILLSGLPRGGVRATLSGRLCTASCRSRKAWVFSPTRNTAIR